MNSKSTWFWMFAAAGLFVFIFFYRQHLHHVDPGTPKLFPNLKPEAVTGVQVVPRGQKEVRAERTNNTWQLAAPFVYPAQTPAIDQLLRTLEQLPFAAYISEQELKTHAQPDEEFGIEPAQTSLIIHQGPNRSQIHIGHRTPPGDQVYVQIVGSGGIYVTDAAWLKLLPPAAGDWRSTAIADLSRVEFDRLIVTNSGRTQPLELQRNATNHLWYMISPTPARADTAKVEEALQSLQQLSVRDFIDDPRADLESIGLQPPELTLTLAQGTNAVFAIDFGRTNAAGGVYARRHDQTTFVTVSSLRVEPWRASHEAFRNRHLVTLIQPLDHVDVHADETFALQRQSSNSWSVAPQNFAADPALVDGLIGTLSGMEVDFYKDSVTDLELPLYGLDPAAARQYVLQAGADGTNSFHVELNFGTNHEGKVFARRAGESFVYAIKPDDFARLPWWSWQLRDRRLWHFAEADVARVVIQQNGKTRELIHRGTNDWSLAPGSQGMINPFATEETVHRVGDLTAAYWTGHGDDARAGLGFAAENLQLTFELRDGGKRVVAFGGAAPSGFPYATVTLDGAAWFFEFPWDTFQFVQLYLTIPAQP